MKWEPTDTWPFFRVQKPKLWTDSVKELTFTFPDNKMKKKNEEPLFLHPSTIHNAEVDENTKPITKNVLGSLVT
jgi:hypothetical protein